MSAIAKPVSAASESMPAAPNPRPTTMLEKLRALSREDLEAYCLHLQQQVSALSSSSAASTGTAVTATVGPEEPAKRLSTLRTFIATHLENSFKWTVACRRATATFNHSFAVPDAQLFLALVDQPKMLKYKRYSAEDFQEHVLKRHLRGSVRYRNLYMTGNVIVRYDETEGILKITGRYGI